MTRLVFLGYWAVANLVKLLILEEWLWIWELLVLNRPDLVLAMIWQLLSIEDLPLAWNLILLVLFYFSGSSPVLEKDSWKL